MNLFDIIGPIMIGPSSSHTAGAARIGLTARMLLGEKIARADIGLHGSFAKTYRGHGTDKAIVAGLMGMDTDDLRIRNSLELAREAAADGEVPVGCVIVRRGEIVGRGRNRRETDKTALGHAEIEAIADACANLGGWGDLDVSDRLSALLDGVPVKTGNDANVAALGEAWKGGGQGCKNMVFATLGTGVGLSLIHI